MWTAVDLDPAVWVRVGHDGHVKVFEKRRAHAPPGSIPDVLDMFRSEVRFYQEIAPVVGVRVPLCFEALLTDEGTYLRLEDLSSWMPAADPLGVVTELRGLHERWKDRAIELWPWLRGPGMAAGLIGSLYDRTWPHMSKRSDLTPAVRVLGDWLVGKVETAELAEGTAGPLTLCHGDTASNNLATSPDGDVDAVLPSVAAQALFLRGCAPPGAVAPGRAAVGDSSRIRARPTLCGSRGRDAADQLPRVS